MVGRLRWVMLAVMLFSMVATLVGQPAEFWSHPGQAIRFDGLSIYDHTNHKFEFFLGYGWAPYLTACLAYFAAAFALVSALPDRLGLIATFSFILGHFYGGENWLAVRWHAGAGGGLTLYSCALAAAVALAVLPTLSDARFVLMRLRWIAVAALLLDFSNTLLGQPHSYWQNPATVHEGNALSRYFLTHGWATFCVYDAAYCGVILRWLLRFREPERSSARLPSCSAATAAPRIGSFMSGEWELKPQFCMQSL